MFMNNPVYLVLLVLEISIIVIYEFCYNYVKPKYNEKANYVISIASLSM